MKKFPLFILAIIGLVSVFTSSCGDDNSFDDYSSWIAENTEWYDSLAKLRNPNGTPYFTVVAPAWYEKSGVMIHFHNDTNLTAGNLRPLSTSTVKVIYKGEMCNGTAFDSSYLDTDSARTFTLNSGLITGWKIAIPQMRVGDSADVIIPYSQAYGVSGSGDILPYSNLKFSIKLVDITGYEIRP